VWHCDEAAAISIRCGNRRYVAESRQDCRVFVDAPLRMMLERPDEMVLADLPGHLGIPEERLPDVFRVMSAHRMGYMELVDPTKATLTGIARSWRQVHERGHWHATVMVLARDEVGNIALQKRGEEESTGKWDVSVAGHQEIGDDPALAAVRETGEELGLPVDRDWLVPVGKPYRFRKEGSPNVAGDAYRSAEHFVYATGKHNCELASLFILPVTGQLKSQIVSGEKNATQAVRWLPLDKVVQEVDASPQHFSRAIKQVPHPDIVAEIKAI
jgi:8-oxo-dGTP pyrophosphatase MutT (NUDIX family)